MSIDKPQSNALMWRGSVSALYIAESAGTPMIPITEARLIKDRGIEEDRYYHGVGTHCDDDDDDEPWYEVTLIERETINAICCEKKIDLDAGAARRNIVTHGFALNHLVHRTFRIGEAILHGQALREPCPHLADVTNHALVVSLIHRGGLGAHVLRGGIVRVDDVIEEMREGEGGFWYPIHAISSSWREQNDER